MKKLWFTVLVFVFVIACASCNKKVDFDSLELDDVIDYSLVTVSRVSRNAYAQVDYDNSSINDGKKLSDVDYAYLKSFYKTLGEQYRMSPEDMKASYSLNRFDSYYMQSVFHHYYFYPNQTLINYVDFRLVRRYDYATKFESLNITVKSNDEVRYCVCESNTLPYSYINANKQSGENDIYEVQIDLSNINEIMTTYFHLEGDIYEIVSMDIKYTVTGFYKGDQVYIVS